MSSFLIHTSLPASLVLIVSGLMFMSGMVAPRAQEDGQAVFTEAGCARCHSVAAAQIEATVSERMQGPDLGSVGSDHDAAWVVAVVKQERELDGSLHRASFRGSDDQLSAIATWLVELE